MVIELRWARSAELIYGLRRHTDRVHNPSSAAVAQFWNPPCLDRATAIRSETSRRFAWPSADDQSRPRGSGSTKACRTLGHSAGVADRFVSWREYPQRPGPVPRSRKRLQFLLQRLGQDPVGLVTVGDERVVPVGACGVSARCGGGRSRHRSRPGRRHDVHRPVMSVAARMICAGIWWHSGSPGSSGPVPWYTSCNWVPTRW
jgi:hypothetical protein